MPGKTSRSAEVLFGQVREDACVELAVIATFSNPPRVFCIASAGCTALALLSGNTESVTTVDINPAQVHLVLLKKEIIAQLDYQKILYAISVDARQAYSAIRDNLPLESRRFWDKRTKRLRKGVAQCGLADRFLAGGARLFHLIGHSSSKCQAFLSLQNSEQQLQAMSWWNNWQWRMAFKFGLSKTMLRLAFGKEITQKLPTDFAIQIRRRIEHAMTSTPNPDNPYLWQLFLARYPKRDSGLPAWLQYDNITRIKQRLERLQIHHADVLQYLVQLPGNSLDFISLSNILEVASAQYIRQLAEQCARTLSPGGIVMIRHILPISDEMIQSMTESLMYDIDFSAHLKSLERAPFCTEICVMRLEK